MSIRPPLKTYGSKRFLYSTTGIVGAQSYKYGLIIVSVHGIGQLASHTPVDTQHCTGVDNNLNGSYEPDNGEYALADLYPMPVTNTPSSTLSGGVTLQLKVQNSYQAVWGNFGSESLSDGALGYIILNWQGGPNNEPAPKTVRVLYRRAVTQSVSFGSTDNSVTGTLSASATLDGVTGSPASTNIVGGLGGYDTGAAGGDSRFVEGIYQVQGGNVTLECPLNWDLKVQTQGPDDHTHHSSVVDVEANFRVDFCVEGFDVSRFGRWMRIHSGGHINTATDPAFTRCRRKWVSVQ